MTAPALDKSVRAYGKDASDADCCEGYYVHDGRSVLLMPPTGEMHTEKAPGRVVCRLATQAEVDAAPKPIAACSIEHIANGIANPSDLPEG